MDDMEDKSRIFSIRSALNESNSRSEKLVDLIERISDLDHDELLVARDSIVPSSRMVAALSQAVEKEEELSSSAYRFICHELEIRQGSDE